MELHLIDVEGPIAYPGGKDGSYRATCSQGDWASDFGTEAEVRKAGTQHAGAKNATDANLERFDQETVARTTLRIAVEIAALSISHPGLLRTVLPALNGPRRDMELEPITLEMLAPLMRAGEELAEATEDYRVELIARTLHDHVAATVTEEPMHGKTFRPLSWEEIPEGQREVGRARARAVLFVLGPRRA